jgi:structural maintenance of chromosome 4
MINEKRSQFKDVAKILSSHGIDLRYNRFLILQGEVEQISLMKPKAENEDDVGFLEFLEDIIGSNRLKSPIDQLFAKVHEANELRIEKFNRFRVIQTEKDSLEVAKNEAVAYLQTENEKTTFEHNLYQYYRSQSDLQREKAKEEFDDFDKIFAKENEKVVQLLEKRKIKEDDLEEFNKENQARIAATEEAYEKFKEIERKDIDVRAKIKNSKSKGKKLVDDVELEKEKLEKLKEEPERLEAEKNIQESKKVELEKKIGTEEEKLTVAMNSIQEDTKGLQVEKDNKEKELFEIQKAVNDDEAAMNIAASELDMLKNNESKERSQLESLKSKVANAESEIEKKRERMETNSKTVPEFQTKLKDIDSQLVTNEKSMNDLQERNFGMTQKLEEIRSSTSANASRNKVVNFLMTQKSRGKLDGICGRLGDLGGIDKKYDCAISTACGQLDFMVVETIDDAQNCVQALKRDDIGSTTFIALEKMGPYQKHCSPLPNGTPENVPRLFDLVHLKDESIRPAFYFALGDTLVANDLEQATRIAFGKSPGNKKRWRVVTLDGKLVDPSGAMTAGGRPSRGRMGTSAVSTEGGEKEMQALDSKIRENRDQIDQLSNRIEALRREKKQIESDLEIMFKNKDKFAMDVEILVAEIKCDREQIQNQEQLVKNLAPKSKLKEMEKQVETLREKYERSRSKTSKVEIIVKELDRKIQAIIDKKIGSVKTSIDSLKKELSVTNNILVKNQVALKTNARNLEKCEAKVTSLENEIDQCHETITQLKESMKAMETEAKEVTKMYEELSEQKEKSEEELKSRQSEIAKLKSEENKLNMTNVDMKFELDKLASKLKEKEGEVSSGHETSRKYFLFFVCLIQLFLLLFVCNRSGSRVDEKNGRTEAACDREQQQ